MAIKQVSTGRISLLRKRWKPRWPELSTLQRTRVRHESPSRSPGTESTTTSTSSMPACRRKASCTTSCFNERCLEIAICWKSQPPQAPGPANSHGASTRSGLLAKISMASARTILDRTSVILIFADSPVIACRTNIVRPCACAMKCPPCAIWPITTSITSPTASGASPDLIVTVQYTLTGLKLPRHTCHHHSWHEKQTTLQAQC
ncbi:unannotated protein [freshwater metagenome]|uniref:Unannotated protein n=1 Tax=freshwater metagenome TaxID=449393 RepID=A0A6J7Q1F8_9ZZZZ